MRKTWLLPTLLAIVLLGCERTPTQPATAPEPEAQPAADARPEADAPPPVERPARRQAGALKSELPEGFVLPFEFHRLYDNTGSKEGKAQRRVLVEYLGQEAPAVQASLTDALKAKGFGEPAVTNEGGVVLLDFSRADGTSVQAKIEAGRKKARVPNAKGTVHLVWTAG